jgi:iron complex transport system ATP-binding protein
MLGPNGCGKSTLIKTIARECYPLVRPESSLQILGRERWDVFELRAALGIVSQDLMAACKREVTGRDVVLSGFFSSIGVWPHQQVTPQMREKAALALESLEASHLAERLVTEMSSGEAQRVLIGRALVHNPKALLFDEPSTSLDVAAQHELRGLLRGLAASGVGLILATHHLADIVPEVERVILLERGRVAADGPKAKILTAARMSGLFGVAVKIERRAGFYHMW